MLESGKILGSATRADDNRGAASAPEVMEPSNPAAVDGVSSMSKREYFLDLFWRHKHTTVTLCFVFWSFGMCVAFLGPTLLDLGCKTQTVFSTMSWVFFSQSLLILLGAAAGGVLVERLTPNLTLVMGTAGMALTMALIPVCHVLGVLAVVLAIMGFFMGCIDTVSNVYMIRIYGKDVSPFLQVRSSSHTSTTRRGENYGGFWTALCTRPCLSSISMKLQY